MTIWLRWDPTWLPPTPGLFLEKETIMTTTAPAHPWIKTGRTLLAGIISASVLVPLAVQAAGLDPTAEGFGWLAGSLALLAAVTRILAVPQINAVVQQVLGLGSRDVEAARVVALVEPTRPQRVLAGEAAPQPTGAVLSSTTTVDELKAE